MRRERTCLLLKCSLALMVAVAFFFSMGGAAAGYENKALILVDEPGPAGPYLSSEATLENLLGHFDLTADTKSVDSYTSGELENYRVTFYIGNSWDRALPADLLEDVLVTQRQVVWINYNLWDLAWGAYQQPFEARYGFSYVQTLPTGSFNKVTFAGRSFIRSQGEFGQVDIVDGSPAEATAYITDGSTSYPYIVQSGNFYFVADNPLNQTAEDSPYLVFAEGLHGMVGIEHPVNHRALVRIEDVDPTEDPAKIRAIADYLYSEDVPFALAVIPRFSDPLGATGAPGSRDLADAPELVSALNYAVSRGGTIIMHGVTHQYGAVANPYNGVSGPDSEFYVQQLDGGGNVINVSPLPEDSTSWVQARIDTGNSIFTTAGLDRPYIWETPHYLASGLDHGVFADNFSVSYERFADTYFPHVINRTVYGSRLIPENLGYISPGIVSPQKIINRAGRNLAVRDGFASFFYHPEVDLSYLQTTVAGIKAKGFTFVDVSTLAESVAPVITYSGPSGAVNSGSPVISASCLDPPPSSGIEPASATVSLNGGAALSCSYAAGVISCPVSGLADGSYSVEVTIFDAAGNSGRATGGFSVDTVAPVITNLAPTGTIFTGSPVISADYADGSGSGVDPQSVRVTLDGDVLGGCDTGSGSVTCAVANLAGGAHTLEISVADLVGNSRTITGAFEVYLCNGEAPGLELGGATAYWASFADYQARMLSVDYVITNYSELDAREVTIAGAMSTHGVALTGSLPQPVDIDAGNAGGLTLVYRVPAGVTSFRSNIYATARDACDQLFSYPGPYPGQ